MDTNTSNLKGELNKWISEIFKKDNFEKIDFQLQGTSEKGDGYMSDILFVTVIALTSNGETKEFNLVIKLSKQSESLRKTFPIQSAFKREAFIYTVVVPAFQRFETEKKVEITDHFFPKCYGSILYKSKEALFLHNLKSIGFELHDRLQPLDMNHLRLTFNRYGTWHGLSIAYRDQKPKEFQEMFKDMKDILLMLFTGNKNPLEKTETYLYSILGKNNQIDLRDRLKQRFKEGFPNVFSGLLELDEPNSVLLHGDCWNNNMMFHYEDAEKRIPTAVKFLDFQVSKLYSPVFDLSYHLYTTASEKELENFRELLQIYHTSLSKTIRSLGSDPDKLFPYSELVKQWKKYSSYGLLLCSLLVPLTLSDKEDTIDMQDINGDNISELLEKINQTRYHILSSRCTAVVKHFLDFNDF